MRLKTQLLPNNQNLEVLSLLESQPMGKSEIKQVSKLLCKAYKNGEISSTLFEKIITILMVALFESSIESKFIKMNDHLEKKLYKQFV